MKPIIPASRPDRPLPRLITALDTADMASARALVGAIGTRGRFYKIGLGLLADDGIGFAVKLRKQGCPVFLDLKLFDIPSTVERAVGALARYPAPEFLTVHGDPGVVAAAIRGRGDAPTQILATTILTSQTRDELDAMLLIPGSMSGIVRKRAQHALDAGADGLIVSPQELHDLRQLPECKGKLLVTPGIRPAGESADDQHRVATPAAAIRAGADHLVVGRPIIDASDPAAAYTNIADAIADAAFATG